MVAPINSIKHLVNIGNASVASGTAANLKLAESVVAPATAESASIKEGSVLKAMFVEMWIWGGGTTGVDTQFSFFIYKDPGGSNPMTFAESTNAGTYNNKKNIFFSSQGVLGAGVDGAQAIPVHRGWIKIPKGKQRFGLGDRMNALISTSGSAIQRCGIAIYKEYI